MTETFHRLADLGWSNHFQAQLTPDEVTAALPARITELHRARIEVMTTLGPLGIGHARWMHQDPVTIADWLLLDAGHAPLRILERKSLIARRSAGTEASQQLIAANIDTMGIVSSCNADYNLPRIERYVALARQAGVAPLVILTKADLAGDAAAFASAAGRDLRGVHVLALDATDPAASAQLDPWCAAGQTLALVGMSGVGKTTLSNLLTGGSALTGGIRAADGRGRHTTTSRSMRRLLGGGWLIDTPGMRELRLLDVAEGIDAVFDDVAALAADCRFGDCAHQGEPGCAIGAAIAEGRLDAGRLDRWRKLQREDRFNTESAAERGERAKKLGRIHKQAKAARRERRKGWD